jgi:hypothetical protein
MLANAARKFGITVTKEPTIYVYRDRKGRPDLLFHTHPKPVATDVTIVSAKEIPGDAAKTAEQEKTEDHQEATSRLQHDFIPFACEPHGLIGQEGHRLIQHLAKALLPQSRKAFIRYMLHTASTAIAIGRADTMYSARYSGENSWNM